MEFSEVIRNRYSCKKYDGRQIEKEQLDQILEAGRLAPTAKNLQEQRIYVIQTEEGLAKIDKLTPCRYGAPTVLAVAYDRENVFTYPGGKRDSGVEDAAIVAAHMILAAKNAGVESCWLNFFDPEEAKRELGLPGKRGSPDADGSGLSGKRGRPAGESRKKESSLRDRDLLGSFITLSYGSRLRISICHSASEGLY